MASSGGHGAVDAAEAPYAGGKQGGGGGVGGEGGHAAAAGGKAGKTAESMDEFTKRSFTATQKILREQRFDLNPSMHALCDAPERIIRPLLGPLRRPL